MVSWGETCMAATPARATSHSAAPSLAASLRETSGLVEPMYMLAPTSAGGDMNTKLGHLHAQPPMSAVAAPSLITWDPLQFATIGGGLQWQMGLLEEKRCFHLNLLLTLDHPLPSGHLADVHQGAVRQQWSELSVKIQQYSLQRHSWPDRQNKFWQGERKPLGLQIHVVEFNTNIPFHVAKALLSKSYWGGDESGFKHFVKFLLL